MRKVDSVAALLPADVRRSGTLRAGSSIGFPPGAYYPNGQDKPPAGQDIDLADAVARVLGVKLNRQDASFETILPALTSGKYDFGTGNFGVTTERLRTVDFVTYINDGQGFAVKKGSTTLKGKVTDLTQLCGLTIGTGAGTTFEATLTARKGVCAKAGKKPYDVKVYSENGAVVTALQSGRIDLYLGPNPTAAYHVAATGKTEVVGAYSGAGAPLQGLIAATTKKGGGLAKPLADALNHIIENGTYAKVLKRWGLSDEAVTKSEINPPGLPKTNR